MGGAFYNERDPFAAQWLRNLIAAGLIAPGVVDERDIRDIRPVELAGFTQCHFFAGIGVWALALRRAGWADDRPVWTGSCPCQPFSAAGPGKGFDDERHLWPHWYHLIAQHGPDTVFGEQVASKDGLGWLDLVSADLEAAGYAFSAADLCAAGFGGAHIRQRLYFVGLGHGFQSRLEGLAGHGDGATGRTIPARPAAETGGLVRLAHTMLHGAGPSSGNCACAETAARGGDRRLAGQQPPVGIDRTSRGLAEPKSVGCGTGLRNIRQAGNGSSIASDGCSVCAERSGAPLLGRNPADWLFCRDGKWRPVEPSTFPLADASPNRMGRLRAYGNALDLETATGFVEAVSACITAPMERAA